MSRRRRLTLWTVIAGFLVGCGAVFIASEVRLERELSRDTHAAREHLNASRYAALRRAQRYDLLLSIAWSSVIVFAVVAWVVVTYQAVSSL